MASNYEEEEEEIAGAQVLISCEICGKVVELYCKSCDAKLCKVCSSEHVIANPSERHDLTKYTSTFPVIPTIPCAPHSDQICDFYCLKCDEPTCNICIASEVHQNHEIEKLSVIFNVRKESLQREMKTLKHTTVPEYERFTREIKKHLENLSNENEIVKQDISSKVHEWKIPVDEVIQHFHNEVDEKEKEQRDKLEKDLTEYNSLLSSVNQTIKELEENLRNPNDIVLSYRSGQSEYRRVPTTMGIGRQIFTPVNADIADACKTLGRLSLKSKSSSRKKTILKKVIIANEIRTSYNNLYFVCCCGNSMAWISGDIGTISKINEKGKVIEAVNTASGNPPASLALNNSGDLLYSDFEDKSINCVKNGIVSRLIATDWKPVGIHCTSSGDLLVFVTNVLREVILSQNMQRKLVRYSGNSPTWSRNCGNHHFVSSHNPRYYVLETLNGNICAVEYSSISIFTLEGEVKSQYTDSERYLKPMSITTDSEGHILVSEKNGQIHVLDLDGNLISVLKMSLSTPYGLCTDKNDNLWVVEKDTGKVKVFKYME